MNGKELVKKLQADGWKIDRIRGSHYVMKKGKKTEIIPVHNKDIPPGLLKTIIKRTELK